MPATAKLAVARSSAGSWVVFPAIALSEATELAFRHSKDHSLDRISVYQVAPWRPHVRRFR